MSGNKMVDTILVAISTIVGMILLGVFLYTQVFYEKPLPENNQLYQELLAEVQRNENPANFQMDQMILNLQSRTTRLRFLDVEMHFVPFESRHLSLFEDEKPIIQDIIIDTASRMTPDELNSISGKILLEDRIKRRVNEHLKTKALREILYVRFVVQ